MHSFLTIYTAGNPNITIFILGGTIPREVVSVFGEVVRSRVANRMLVVRAPCKGPDKFGHILRCLLRFHERSQATFVNTMSDYSCFETRKTRTKLDERLRERLLCLQILLNHVLLASSLMLHSSEL